MPPPRACRPRACRPRADRPRAPLAEPAPAPVPLPGRRRPPCADPARLLLGGLAAALLGALEEAAFAPFGGDAAAALCAALAYAAAALLALPRGRAAALALVAVVAVERQLVRATDWDGALAAGLAALTGAAGTLRCPPGAQAPA